MTDTLYIKPAPEGLFPDHPSACFVSHRPSNRRMPATWTTCEQAEQFIAAVADIADWTSPDVRCGKELGEAIDAHGGSWDDLGRPYLPRPAYRPSHAEIADLLDKALDVLQTNGFWQGDERYFHDPDQEDQGLPPENCRVCTRGAINVAADGHPELPETARAVTLSRAAMAALEKTLGVYDITIWNDVDGRTLSDVQDAMTRTATRLRENPDTIVHAKDPEDEAWEALVG